MEYGWWELALRLGTGLIIGFFVALTGMGGASLVLPALTIIMRLPSSVAVGTASLYAFLTQSFAAFARHRLRTLDRASTAIFLGGALPGNIVVSYLIYRYIRAATAGNGENLRKLQETLSIVIAVVLLFTVLLLILSLLDRNSGRQKAPMCSEKQRIRHRIVGALLGAVVGGVMGATSIGGGVLVVPVLIMFFGLSANKTVGTSIVIAAVLSLQTTIMYMLGGQTEYLTAGVMSLGSMGGVYLGTQFSARIPERPLQAIVISVIFVASLSMLLQATR
ncbi:MAG: sulfite exporter TauE/SafE family protein [Acidobacteria bacterium]|nr:sulfite exporter TauE/SafE family protein [Acidobacteriota bacterium]